MHRQVLLLRRRTERGNVLIMTACSILLLLGVMVLAIDLGYLLNGKAELQNALDAAALAAVTQTHVVIARPALPPPVPSYDQVQINLIQQTAQRFGRLNTVRLPPHDGSTAAESRAIELNVNDIDLSGRGNVPPVISVTTSVALPTLFAGVFGFQNIDVRATSTARLVPVNGGTGLISGGAVDVSAGGYGDMVSGCWRPLLIPDSYIDPNGIVRRPTVEVDFATGGLRIQPPPDGSFYRSRFVGNSAAYPFVDLWQASAPAVPGTPSDPTSVTSLRDFDPLDPNSNIMGLKTELRGRYFPDPNNVNYIKADYRIVNFAATFNQLGLPAAGEQAYYGYCGRVQVGQAVTVFPIYQDDGVYSRMRDLRVYAATSPYDARTKDAGGALEAYGYITTPPVCNGCRFTTPNTHPLIIPVLLCNPFEFYAKTELGINRGGVGDADHFTVTNIGALFIESAGYDGDIQGRFIREIMAGGTQIAPGSIPSDNLRLLPVSAKLVRQ